jgi:hypothetical protein
LDKDGIAKFGGPEREDEVEESEMDLEYPEYTPEPMNAGARREFQRFAHYHTRKMRADAYRVIDTARSMLV